MKKTFKITLLIFVLLTAFTLAACSGGVSSDEAKETISNFLGALSAGEYKDAGSFMHPDVAMTESELEDFAYSINTEIPKANLSQGVEVEKITGFYQSFYNSDYNGSGYELRFQAKIGGASVNVTALVVRNENGYGLYGINIVPG